jgi:hypothetical protein
MLLADDLAAPISGPPGHERKILLRAPAVSSKSRFEWSGRRTANPNGVMRCHRVSDAPIAQSATDLARENYL